jgi:hypothetical protein
MKTRHPDRLLAGFCLALAWAALSYSPCEASDPDEKEDPSKRCLNARSIRGTDVIDDDHIVFEIQGRRLFLNVLPRTCKGLSQQGRFSYEISTRSLCAGDKIRILREAGNTFYEGKACSLGRFVPISREDLENFYRDRMVTPEPHKPEPAEVEDVVTEKQ